MRMSLWNTVEKANIWKHWCYMGGFSVMKQKTEQQDA